MINSALLTCYMAHMKGICCSRSDASVICCIYLRVIVVILKNIVALVIICAVYDVEKVTVTLCQVLYAVCVSRRSR